MPMKDWSTTAANNDTAGSVNFAEGQAPSTVNNSARQAMADVRAWYEDVEWRDWGHTPSYVSATSFTVTGDQTAVYLVGRRIRMTDATTLYGTIASVAYATVTTVTVTMDSGSMSASLSAVSIGFSPAQNSIPRGAIYLPGTALQRVEATPYTTYGSTTSAIPFDDTIPQNTEGTEILTATITPKLASSRLRIDVSIPILNTLAAAPGDGASVALFKTGTANALAIGNLYVFDNAGVELIRGYCGVNFYHEMSSTSVASQTFTVRYGPNGTGTAYINGSASARLYGGISAARLSITEYAA